MKIVDYEEFIREDSKLADKAKDLAQDIKSRDAFFAGAKWCRENLAGYVMELTTCKDCIFSHRIHRDLFCGRLRTSSTPEAELRVDPKNYCSLAIQRKAGT